MSSSTTKSYFEVQRELVLSDVGASLENVLQNLNKLNRSLEGVIAVGNEFSQVEGLWSQFENVMASAPTKDVEKDPEPGKDARDGEQERERRT
nr:dash complex subunit dad1 [Quercus suber]